MWQAKLDETLKAASRNKTSDCGSQTQCTATPGVVSKVAGAAAVGEQKLQVQCISGGEKQAIDPGALKKLEMDLELKYCENITKQVISTMVPNS